jgi:putative tryptophan/tyrosine transport system substrate-binding protein
MRRREFISLLGGAVAAWPLAAGAQQPERMRRIGVLMSTAADDPESPLRVAAFAQGLGELGWTVGRNVQIDYRWGGGDPERFRRSASELVALAPNVILANSTPAVLALQQATRAVPIVFVNVADPVGSGIVGSLARPGGNATGFTVFEYSIGAKWLELLKEIAPRVTQVAVLRDHRSPAGIGQFSAIQTVASSLKMELYPLGVDDIQGIDDAVAAAVRKPTGGMIVTGSPVATKHRESIIGLAARRQLPAVYTAHAFVSAGGLISYGPDRVAPFRNAAGYIDRILKGERQADLPVQHPTKYELVINLKAAKALGLEIPPTLLARADEVIE